MLGLQDTFCGRGRCGINIGDDSSMNGKVARPGIKPGGRAGVDDPCSSYLLDIGSPVFDSQSGDFNEMKWDGEVKACQGNRT